MDKKARTEQFLSRLGASPACASAVAALEQIAQVLNEIENEFTSIPYNPETWNNDGRMYPPQEDSRRSVAGHPDMWRYRSVGHNIYVAKNGAIMIALVNGGSICLNKPGSNGLTIAQIMASPASKHSSPASTA